MTGYFQECYIPDPGSALYWAQVVSKTLDTIFLSGVPIALLAGFALHRALFRSRIPSSRTARARPGLATVGLPLVCLLLWVGLCFGFKLLTWKPFAGDAPGSIELTNFLLLGGAAFVGGWISARLRQP